MPVLVCLNELSCAEPTSRGRADEAMTDLIDLLRTLRQWRDDIALITQVALSSIELAQGYYVSHWINSAAINRERWRMIRAIQNRAPFLSAMPDGFQDDTEYKYLGRPAEAIGTAHLLNGLVVSLRIRATWDTPWLSVERSVLQEGPSGEVDFVSESVEVRNAAKVDHANEHKNWIHDVGRDELATGSDIWENRDRFFPHLAFLPRVEEDLRSLRADWVQPVAIQLAKLEDAIAEWQASVASLPAWRTKITGEFEARQRDFCEFVDLDGTLQVFELHARMTPGPGRLHFRLVPEDRTARVAYIGRKRD